MRDYHALEILSSIKGALAKTPLESEIQDIILMVKFLHHRLTITKNDLHNALQSGLRSPICKISQMFQPLLKHWETYLCMDKSVRTIRDTPLSVGPLFTGKIKPFTVEIRLKKLPKKQVLGITNEILQLRQALQHFNLQIELISHLQDQQLNNFYGKDKFVSLFHLN